MRKTFIVGNWKCNKNTQEAQDFARLLRQNCRSIPEGVMVGVCPTHLSLEAVKQEMQGSDIQVGAQNAYWEASGAFTGQVSMKMLKDSDFNFTLVGHSEQRQFFGDTDEAVNKKVQAALELDLGVIVCIGESLEERESGTTEKVLETQLSEGLKDVKLSSAEKFVIAYEPVWAIGTGKTATPEMAQEAHRFVRQTCAKLLGEEIAAELIIQYGGSAKPANARELLDQEDIDGLLVGGASLDVESFTAIINA